MWKWSVRRWAGARVKVSKNRLSVINVGSRYLSTARSPLSKVRNIGIIAHIDAGKTTTTERMLYYAGISKNIGDVDTGDTITDFLEQERSRGITIQSAAISFPWRNTFGINLIDTPGHIDFTFEVIRALKVIDSCVVILDAVAGVEAQTEKVWKQSKSKPKICFINKMDRIGASFNHTVNDLINKFMRGTTTKPVLVNIPYYRKQPTSNDYVFQGVVDVVNGKRLTWNPGNPDEIIVDELDGTSLEQCNRCRESMIETLTEYDEDLVQHFLEEAEGDYYKVSAQFLNASIRKLTMKNMIVPVLCGASFKNIGVQPLLDAIVNYLPSPIEAELPELNDKTVPMKYDPKVGCLVNNNKNLCIALAFKVITDPIRGKQIFIRIYSGTLNSGNTVYNSTTGEKFKLGKLLIPHAGTSQPVNILTAGQIGLLTGSTVENNISTGDTLITHSSKKDGLKSLNKKKELTLKINSIFIPPPVFGVSIEPRTLSNKKSMEEALNTLITEDPSLSISQNDETGQTVLNGMGELHLEIAKDRLVNDLKADVEFGQLMVSYKETINSETNIETYESDDGYRFSLSLLPNSGALPNCLAYPLGVNENFLIMEKNGNWDKEWKYQVSFESILNSIIASCIVGLQRGGKIANFPLYACSIKINSDWSVPPDIETPQEILKITRNLIFKALNDLKPEKYNLLEPIMNLHLTIPQSDIGTVLQDLTGARKAQILSIEDESSVSNSGSSTCNSSKNSNRIYIPSDAVTTLHANKDKKNTQETSSNVKKIIKAKVPLREITTYTNKLRSLSQGRGEFNIEYSDMEKVTNDRLQSILHDL
ncbi:CEI_1a_G0028570.mRNA.1.CDS.1 [Saccharomyces cerevisiae]|nr:CEI_1a_G0028570.mRNA.1.CDS.1 [Saccharomyces cerevisiae]CAI7350748.1 CEI_1a_G0028570.mRNA.1.CDS.1 [Saccharomyces cerevisiae]